MAKFIPDFLSRRWVIISPSRIDRPHGKKDSNFCPFCEGNEECTPPEIFRIGEGKENEKGWNIRVIPNKFPIIENSHEVIIHTPKCNRELEDMTDKEIEKIFLVYKERFNKLKEKGKVMIFSNKGKDAGASLKHSHSQIVIIPEQIKLDTLEKEPIKNIIKETSFFTAYCPDFSQWPYEIWIAPKKENSIFSDIENNEIIDLSKLFLECLKKLKKINIEKNIADEFNYNYYIFYKENWYLRIIPRFTKRAGFELGTGLSVNPISPEIATEDIKKA